MNAGIGQTSLRNEHYDARLWRLGSSLVTTLTSVDMRSASVLVFCVSAVSGCPAASRDKPVQICFLSWEPCH